MSGNNIFGKLLDINCDGNVDNLEKAMGLASTRLMFHETEREDNDNSSQNDFEDYEDYDEYDDFF